VSNLLSDLNWKALISGGISAGLKGAVSNVAVYALAWGLDSMFGLEVGKPGKQQQKQELINSLKDINGELQTIDSNLQAISAQITQLGLQMQSDFEKTLSAISDASVQSAWNSIKSFWQRWSQDVSNASISGSVPAGTSAAFATSVLQPGTNGVQYALNQITQGLLPASATSTGLLDTWTSTLILNVQQGQPIGQAYQWLEQNFLQYTSYLFMGHSLMVAATMQQAAPQTTGTAAAAQTVAQQEGLNYMTSVAAPDLAKVTQMFIQSVHRLILSQYQSPNAGNTAFVPFVTQAEADGILSRAYLAAWLINQKVEENDGTPVAANPGIIVVAYYRPSQMAGGKAPALQPTGYASSSGKLFQLESLYQNNWYKVVDYGDSNCSQILDYAASNIIIAEYQWMTPTPAVGTAVGGTGVLANLVPAYYDKTMLAPVAAATDNTVIYGYATDLSGLQNLYFETPNDWTLSLSPNNIKYCTWTPAGVTSGAQLSVSSTLKATGQYKNGPGSFEANLLRAATYVGTTPATLLLGIAAQGIQSVSSVNEAPGDAITPLNTNIEVSFGNQGIANSSASCSNPTSDKSGMASTNAPTVNLQTVQPFSVSPNQSLTLAFETAAVAGKQSWWKDYNNTGGASTGSAQWKVTSVSLAWPQPRVS
jgi:hypothetical protein